MKLRSLGLILGSVLAVAIAAMGWLAVRGSGGDDDGTTVAGLIRRLQTGPIDLKCDAANTLAGLAGPGAEPAALALIDGLQDADAVVRAECARAIGLLFRRNPTLPTVEAAATALTSRLKDREPRVRSAAALGFRQLGRDTAGLFEALVEGLRSEDSAIRTASETELLNLGLRNPDGLRRLLVLLDDPSTIVQSAAKSLLTRPLPGLSPDLFLPYMATVLRSGSVATREVVATMLGRSVGRTAAGRDLLMAVLKDVDPAVRLAATAALGAYSEETPARTALRIATIDSDLRVRATAWASLAVGRRAARAESIAELRRALLGDRSRADLADAIEIAPAAATPRLIAALHDPNAPIRAAAARALGEVVPSSGDVQPTIDALIGGLADSDPSVRRASAASLARYGPAAAEAAAALRRASRDADRSVSGQAFLSLKSLDGMRRTR